MTAPFAMQFVLRCPEGIVIMDEENEKLGRRERRGTDMKRKQKKILVFLGYSMALSGIICAFVFCFCMVNSINRRMNESAASNLLNTTSVIQNTLDGFLEKDLDALTMIGDFHQTGEVFNHTKIESLCNALGFDWIGLVDGQGNGMNCFSGKFDVSDLPFQGQWIPEDRGYSNPYIGRSGRPQIALWVPIYQNGDYMGTVFGGVILSKYYSANVFTFYDGYGRTYLFNGQDGEWILKSLGTDGTAAWEGDIYSLLLASGNREEDITAFRQAVDGKQSGVATLDFNGELSYLCFLPLQSSQGWYVTTVIARDMLLKESSQVQRMIRGIFVVLCAALMFAAIVFAVWQVRKTRMQETHYRDALFANISANLDSAFLIYDKSSRTVVFASDNMNRLLGLDREWIRKNAAHLFDWCGIPEENPDRIAFLEGTLEMPAVCEVCAINEPEEPRTIRLELIPADLEQEIAVLSDITGDKEIQRSLIEAMERAEAASKAKNNFLSAVSHDLRTPINGVIGMTAIAAVHLDNRERVRDCLSKISDSASQLLTLINEVLDMSQMESDRIELAEEPFNLAELLQKVISVSYPGARQKNHTIGVNIHVMEHEEVLGDSVYLTRAVSNLISNAIKYTPQEGMISLTLQERPSEMRGYGCYELTVQDNGIGMSDRFITEKLFQPFEREEDVRISRIQGTGLGMSIVKRIVEMMAGNIRVESEKGRGSTIRVTFHLRLQKQVSNYARQLAGLPVLVADGDQAACGTSVELLLSVGMQAEYTNNGADAVRMAVQRHRNGADYRVILLDGELPGMNGVETTRKIREELEVHIPIVVLTASEWSETEGDAVMAGADECLSKPIYRAKLLQKLTEIVTGNKRTAELPGSTLRKGVLEGKRVLVVEDNELNKEIAVELLQVMGIQTVCARDGMEAVECFEKSVPWTYDLILMDIQMPRLNGYEASRRIRSMERLDSRTVPIVAMTADAFNKDKNQAIEAGMNEYLTKPISIEHLERVLERFLKKERLEKNEQNQN